MGKTKQVDQTDPEALKAAGNKAFTSQNYEEAADMFSKAIALKGDNHIYYANSKFLSHNSNVSF